MPQDFEDHTSPGLEFGYDTLVIVDRAKRFAIDFGDHIAARKLDVVREAGRLNFRHQHTSLALHTDARGTFRCEAIDAQAELGWCGLPLLVIQAARLRWKYTSAVFDDRGGFFLRAVADVGQLNFAS